MSTWPQFHADEANSGFGNADGPKRAPRFKWQTEIGDVRYASPVIAGDGTAYIGNLQGTLFAIDNNGNIKWKFDATDKRGQNAVTIVTAVQPSNRRQRLTGTVTSIL